MGEIRVAAGYSQAEAARLVGRGGQAFISQLERGLQPLTIDVAAELARLYGVAIETLLSAASDAAEISASSSEASLEGTPGELGVAPEDEPSEDIGTAPDPRDIWCRDDDQYSVERQQTLRECRDAGINEGTALRMAVALQPRLSRTPATIEFFEAMQVAQSPLDRTILEWRAIDQAERDVEAILLTYLALAEEHRAHPYIAAFKALSAGIQTPQGQRGRGPADSAPRGGDSTLSAEPPERRAGGQPTELAANEMIDHPAADASSSPDDGPSPTTNEPPKAMPITLSLRVGSHHLVLDRELLPRGRIGYALTDPETGRPARGGIRLGDHNELPADVEIDGHRHTLQPVRRWDASSKRYEDEAQPFERRRAIFATINVHGQPLDVIVRVSRPSDTEWNIAARLSPASSRSPTNPASSNVPAKGTTAQPSRLIADDDEETVKLESIGGAPAIATPLFRLDGVWHCRWAIERSGSRRMVPSDLLELNDVELDPLPKLQTRDGTEIRLEQGNYGSYNVLPPDALLRTTGARTGDFIFVGIDARGLVDVRRITSQRLGRAASPLKMATLLCGLDEGHPTLASIRWALGIEQGSDLETAIAVAEQRADGQLVRQLRAHARQASSPPDLPTTFSQL